MKDEVADVLEQAMEARGIPSPGRPKLQLVRESEMKGGAGQTPAGPPVTEDELSRLCDLKREISRLEKEESLLVAKLKASYPDGQHQIGEYGFELRSAGKTTVDWKGWVLYRTGVQEKEFVDELVKNEEMREFVKQSTVRTLGKVEHL